MEAGANYIVKDNTISNQATLVFVIRKRTFRDLLKSPCEKPIKTKVRILILASQILNNIHKETYTNSKAGPEMPKDDTNPEFRPDKDSDPRAHGGFRHGGFRRTY